MMEGEAEAVAGDVKLEYHEDDETNKDDGVLEVEEQRVCSLCGDIGFEKSLLLCNKCGFRFQHSYCSRLYPEIDMEKWSCEWCLHEQHHQQKMDTAAAPAAPLDDYEFKRSNKRNKKRKRQRSNSKVFEFLLEIADQSSPEAESYTKLEAKQHRGDDIEDEKVMKRSLSSSSSSFSYGYNKRKFDIDIGLESPTSTATATMITTKLISTTTTSTSPSPREKSSVVAAAGILKRDVHQEMSTNGCFHKTAVTKNKSNNNNNSKAALDRWRNLATNKNKLGCRRYKLLADVHC